MTKRTEPHDCVHKNNLSQGRRFWRTSKLRNGASNCLLHNQGKKSNVRSQSLQMVTETGKRKSKVEGRVGGRKSHGSRKVNVRKWGKKRRRRAAASFASLKKQNQAENKSVLSVAARHERGGGLGGGERESERKEQTRTAMAGM